jgi:hypothetical protein
MNHSTATSNRPSTRARHPRPHSVTAAVTLPQTRPQTLELRDLLEANLQALQALHAEHLRTINLSLRAIDPAELELRAELRALASSHAPWVQAMSETRALLFVALRELIVGANEAELSMQLPQQAVNAIA